MSVVNRGGTQSIQVALQGLVDAGLVPGIGLALVKEGKYSSAFAGLSDLDAATPMSERSRFKASCHVKSMGAIVALEMAEAGILELESPIEALIKELDVGIEKAKAVRIKHLLSHTSGYAGLNIQTAATKWGMTWPKLLKHFAQSKLHFPPGIVFNYEHSENVLLAKALERASGEQFPQLIKTRIYDALQIEVNAGPEGLVTSYLMSLSGKFQPVVLPSLGDIWSSSLSDDGLTLRQLCQFGEALLGKSNLPFSRSVLDILSTPVIPLPEGLPHFGFEDRPTHFGMGIACYQNSSIGGNGSFVGQTCGLRVFRKEGVVIAVAMNAWLPQLRDAIFEWLSGVISTSDLERACVFHPHKDVSDPIPVRFNERQLLGRYAGSMFGSIDIEETSGGCLLGTSNIGASKQTLFEIAREESTLRMRPNRPIPMGIFSVPGIECPALYMGMHTYRKVTAGDADVQGRQSSFRAA